MQEESSDMHARNVKMREMYREGKSFAAIGREFNLSRERVRAIVRHMQRRERQREHNSDSVRTDFIGYALDPDTGEQI